MRCSLPGMTLLDFAGPQCALVLHGTTHLLWKTLEPVKTDHEVFRAAIALREERRCWVLSTSAANVSALTLAVPCS
jgi:hypothetical protein